MQLAYLIHTIAFVILASTTQTSAQDVITYRGYSSTIECSGSSFSCRDGGAVCCGPFPTGFGFSAKFEAMPSGTQGQGYTDACSSFLFNVFGPGDKCWNGGGARATFLNWFHSGGRREVVDGDEANCVAPDGFTYKDGAGVERTIKVPAGNTTAGEDIAKHFRNRDWKALAAYKNY
ncbi:hypothetical protein NMY22_g11669 [Coprinellus aureogranulatus]|nr:hypothetical protein NMY22_g11669 [Coprinellus aureogranulatus]